MMSWPAPHARWFARAACAALLAGGASRVPADEPVPAATLCPAEAEASRAAQGHAADDPAPERAGHPRDGGRPPPVRLTPEQAERLQEAARQRSAELRTKRPTPDPATPEE